MTSERALVLTSMDCIHEFALPCLAKWTRLLLLCDRKQHTVFRKRLLNSMFKAVVRALHSSNFHDIALFQGGGGSGGAAGRAAGLQLSRNEVD